MTFAQSEFDIRCEWGERGVAALAPISDAIIIVDILSFTTCVTVAVSQGAMVFPFRHRDDSRIAFANSVQAELAGERGGDGFSLSPVSLSRLPAGTRVVLPSPNGSALSLATGRTPTFAGCLRNSKVVAEAARRLGPRVSVVPAGERWKGDHTLRPAFEDLVGAGAIIRHLRGRLSPEAQLAVAAFDGVKDDLLHRLKTCSSGKELVTGGFEKDVVLSAQIDVDDSVPLLQSGAYSDAVR